MVAPRSSATVAGSIVHRGRNRNTATRGSLSVSGLVALLLTLETLGVHAWIQLPLYTRTVRNSGRNIATRQDTTTTTLFVNTPFEADLYDDDDDDAMNPFLRDASSRSIQPLSTLVDPDSTRLVIGLNKYSHDTSLCAADAQTGQVLYAQAKERIGRRRRRQKHDAGNVAELVDTCLEALDLDLSHVDCVIANNHHHRILPLESSVAHMEWEAGLYMNGGREDGYTEPENLFPDVSIKWELSHHLAHAYSVAAQAPFDSGMIVVMDGIGETYRTMMQGMNDPNYISDFNLLTGDEQGYQEQEPESKTRATRVIQLVPSNLDELARHSRFDWREAESVYTFSKHHDDPCVDIQPIFKRFTQEHSPPVLYNHGFENMDSLGALYSRASSHIFGDWNACGKVMGLAPWAASKTTWTTTSATPTISSSSSSSSLEGSSTPTTHIQPPVYDAPIVSGSLYRDDDLVIDRSLLQGLPLCARNDPDLFQPQLQSQGNDDRLTEETTPQRRKPYDFDRPHVVPDYTGTNNTETGNDLMQEEITLESSSSTNLMAPPAQVALEAMAVAHRMQIDLETVALDFIRHFQLETGCTNLCLAGGVALNSVLNGRLARELQQHQQQTRGLFIPPYPGDEGIAVGCCAYGLFGRRRSQQVQQEEQTINEEAVSAASEVSPAHDKTSTSRPPVWKKPLSPYLGGLYSESEIQEALDRAAPWIDVEVIRDVTQRHKLMAEELASGGVIAWYHSRSEIGPRALGHRSILADPRKYGLVRFINQFVKQRETFRPFAPSVLAEHVSEWFDDLAVGEEHDGKSNVSPYMSLTAQVKEQQRHKIPAVTHVDGSSRLQTVTSADEPSFHALITQFWRQTGIPMVLNTSFNTLPGEPIVETPVQAIRSFLYTKGNLELLVMEDFVIRRKPANLRKLLGDEEEGRRRTTTAQAVAAAAAETGFTEPARPKRAGSVMFQARFSLPERPVDEDDRTNVATTWVKMPNRILDPDNNDTGDDNNPESSLSWFELLDELEGELLSACDGTLTLNEILARYAAIPSNEQNSPPRETDGREDEKTKKANQQRMKKPEAVDEETQRLVQNVVHRLVRLYEETFIYW